MYVRVCMYICVGAWMHVSITEQYLQLYTYAQTTCTDIQMLEVQTLPTHFPLGQVLMNYSEIGRTISLAYTLG